VSTLLIIPSFLDAVWQIQLLHYYTSETIHQLTKMWTLKTELVAFGGGGRPVRPLPLATGLYLTFAQKPNRSGSLIQRLVSVYKWLRSCFCRWLDVRKHLLHSERLYGFSPEWVCPCAVRSWLFWKHFLHSAHLYLSLWIFICEISLRWV